MRITVDILILLMLFIFPWWVPFVVAVIMLFVLPSFYEIVVLGLIIDSLYNAPIERFHHIQYVITFLAIFLVLMITALKSRLRFY